VPVVARIVEWFDRWQRRHTASGFVVAVLKKFGEDRASSLSALVAFYAFFSLFPLLLALVSILGFVLESNPSLRDDVLDTLLGRIPVIGPQLADDVHPLTGSGVALAVGLVGALWAGLGVTVALDRAFGEIWDVPRFKQPNALRARARGLLVLVVLGLLLVVATWIAGSAVGGGIGGVAGPVAAAAGSILLNGVVFLIVFALLTPGREPVRDLLPGVAVVAAGWFALQSLGDWYVNRVVKDASATYGTFALVIGLMSWFLVGAHLVLVAAEVNVVRRWKLWPRSLTGDLQPADRLALQRFAAATRSAPNERIAVRFGEPGDPPPRD
jgi:membrane protein